MGGALTGIEQGFQQREIQESAFRLQRQAETKERIVVGVNEFVTEKVNTPPILRVDPAVEENRRAEMVKLREGRDAAAVDAVLAKIRTASGGSKNMMPLLIEAAELYVTVGEMCHVLREEWGEYHEVMTL
jgi:methylmalonyl-CoA mutase, N-terminal domain